MSDAGTDETWAVARSLASGLGDRPSHTIERPAASAGGDVLSGLGVSDAPRLVYAERLGAGGMGEVVLASEPALGRHVAVKRVLSDRRSARNRLKLLQEAWILARLDHPNIPPVHRIERDVDGEPSMVMKRIDGVPWSRLMHDTAEITARFDVDSLEWNLRVFTSVCNAVAYAHQRGILHMDLKPENVMVGTFGEVYVMDWGVALSLHADDAPRIPVARETHEILGTPSYLAPEVLEGDGTRLGVWTDVFLLGGLLHEIVTGRPPHRGETMMAVVHDILERDPQIDDARWPGLAAIANRAMQRDPALRHPNVESVRQDMERYLRRRDAERLCEDAERRAAGFLRDVEAAPPEATASPDETKQGTYTDGRSLDEIHTQFGAIRFGYLAALERWPELESARRGLTEVTERLVSFELARGRVDAAATALASLPVVDEALRLRVEEARREHASRQRALEALASDHDPKAGQRTRLFVASVLAVTWTLLPLGAWIAGVTAADQPAELVIGIAAVDLVLVLGLLYWARESMTKSSINRGLAGTLVLVLVAQVVLGILSIQVGLTPSQLHVVTLFLWTVAVAFVSVFVDPRFWVTTYVFAAGLAIVAAIPDTLTLVATVTNFALFLGILRIWWMPLEALRR